MNYELQVYAMSPTAPTLGELLAQASESGLDLEVSTGAEPPAARRDWQALALRAAGCERGGFTIEVSSALDRAREQFEADREAGEEIPDQVLDAARLYVLTLDADSEDEDDQQAAFVIAAWALATCTEALIFDPQEEFFADAESFWGLIMMDEESWDAAAGGEDDDTSEVEGKSSPAREGRRDFQVLSGDDRSDDDE